MINTRGPYYENFLKCGFKFGLRSPGPPLMVLMRKDDKDLNYVNEIRNWYVTHQDGDI
jgi:hypothetical protein